ncbi:conditioned medium factor receptor 1-like isoform X2 [Watersipora subatra]|uniref:conditioned medium factor receptor 1-like isoform X2 n=1 Tax=Watersipora subatra TaxID=2589382 RepID=UPI00355C2E13
MDFLHAFIWFFSLQEVQIVCAILGIFAISVALYLRTFVLTDADRDLHSYACRYPQDKNKVVDYYDVAIVGAGPAGATCGYYLGRDGVNCLLLEKKKFPRDKYCGDAVCKTGIEILQDMGVYDELLKQSKARVADSGGLCSPSGLSYIGRSKEHLGEIPAAIACKRIHLDNAIAMAAKRAGANLQENCPVEEVVFDEATGLWTISIEGSGKSYKSRLLVCADGAPSRLATKLGMVSRPPDGSCSRAYVPPDCHQFDADGVIFYNRDLLPGYSALFRHADGDLNYCVYLIPGNPKIDMDKDLPHWHSRLMKEDANISRALSNPDQIERMKAASLRLGGERYTYGDHVIVIGDAAGMIDPMTGEGIHHAMQSGKMASKFLQETIEVGNYGEHVMAHFQDRWMAKFGSDFAWSWAICKLLYHFPILLDAATAAVARKGDKFLAKWADIMTGRVPKIHLLKPEFVIVITAELFILIWKKLTGQPLKKNAKKKN